LQDSTTSLQYAAFFADSEHKLTPLTTSIRSVLACNLVYKGPAAAAAAAVQPPPTIELLAATLHCCITATWKLSAPLICTVSSCLLFDTALYCLQDSASSLQYAAFFADCEHELTPLTAGMRLVLAYNLVYTGPAAAAPRLAGASPAEVRLQQAVQAWEREIEEVGCQKRIAFLLDKFNKSF
jgi:hypothetical protein